jgi:hypothetical protein
MLQHSNHLEAEYGAGPHTISVPRMRPADGSDLSMAPPYVVDDANFKKLVAVIRIAVPYTGMILSTRWVRSSGMAARGRAHVLVAAAACAVAGCAGHNLHAAGAVGGLAAYRTGWRLHAPAGSTLTSTAHTHAHPPCLHHWH